MTSFEKALCARLRRPVMPGMRGSEQFHAARTKLERIMKAAADTIEQKCEHIADLNLLSSASLPFMVNDRIPIAAKVTITEYTRNRAPKASCDTQPKAGDVEQAPLVSGAVTNEVRQTPPPSDLSTDKDG